MSATPAPRPQSPLGVLQRLLTPREPVAAGERCELCSQPLEEGHGHVVDLDQRSILCACRGCRLLFDHEGAGGRRYRAVGDRVLAFRDPVLDDGAWEALEIPVSVAFFFHNSQLGGPVVLYPSPGGATESELPLDDWAGIVRADARLASMRPDVEALLVHRTSGTAASYLVPITACYELVGTLRMHWRGFDGGADARAEIARFFQDLEHRSRVAEEVLEPWD